MNVAESMMLRINPALCTAAPLTAPLQSTHQYYFVEDFLETAGAIAFSSWLIEHANWGLRFSDGEKILGVPPESYSKCTGLTRRKIAEAPYTAAKTGFAFLQEEVWGPWIDSSTQVPEAAIPIDFLAFTRSDPFFRLMSRIIGCARLELVRLSLARYGPGHFYGLTTEAPSGAEFGFSIDFTRNWRVEWGGLLEFPSATGGLGTTYDPRFNSMFVYSLSTRRCVGAVHGFAEGHRHIVAGQLKVM